MNISILKKYNVSFYDGGSGRKWPDGPNIINRYLYLWRNINDIDDFLADIDMCLSGNFNQVADSDYSDGLFKTYGTLTPDNLIITGDGVSTPTIVPLVDFKELLLSWKAFLLK